MSYKFVISLVLLIILMNFTSAVCTVTFNKESYAPTEIISAEMSCSGNEEKNTDYTLIWKNDSEDEIPGANDTGVTPNTPGESFYESYVIPSGYSGNISAELIGSQLEGIDEANVTGASASSLLITNLTFSGGYIGEVSSIISIVKDENDKLISGGKCLISLWNNDATKILDSREIFMVNGEAKTSIILTSERFDEGIDYAYKVLCYCGSDASESECVDEDGTPVEDSVGSAQGSFTTNTWITVNTVTDKSLYHMRDQIFVCANVTNVGSTDRLGLYIFTQVRCSAGVDNNADTDRVLIIDDGLTPDIRGISANTTQMQCKKFIIPESRYLQGKDSECYASTETVVLDNNDGVLKSYFTISPKFNISDNELQITPDWQQISDNKWNAIVNLSDSAYSDYSGVGIGNIDLRINFPSETTFKSTEQYGSDMISFEDFIFTKYIKNITAKYVNGSDVSYGLELLDDASVEIELRNVDISSTGYYNVSLELNNFEERISSALENQSTFLNESAYQLSVIANKTGTFQLSVECPTSGEIGNVITCTISAKLEESLVQKETDFTCYIKDSEGNEYSSINFNKMITSEEYKINKDFLIPKTFVDNLEYYVYCEASYYNLGGRTDTFYDTFKADKKGIINHIKYLVEDNAFILLLILFICLFLIGLFLYIKKKKSLLLSE